MLPPQSNPSVFVRVVRRRDPLAPYTRARRGFRGFGPGFPEFFSISPLFPDLLSSISVPVVDFAGSTLDFRNFQVSRISVQISFRP